MIKTTDLRLGNLVYDEVSGEIMVVENLNIGENIQARVINRDKYPLPNGWKMGYIPITEEWLLRLGFEYNKGHDTFEKEKQVFEFFKDGFYYTADEGIKQGIEIKYIHQLQNLYFALTGEELPIK